MQFYIFNFPFESKVTQPLQVEGHVSNTDTDLIQQF